IAEALRYADPTKRAAYVAEACGTNTRLRQQVEALLQASETSDTSSDGLTPIPPAARNGATPTVPPTNVSIETSDYQPSESVGTVIAGRYKLAEELGEGGMGHVFMAQQTEPVKRLVAVKLIKAGMDSKAVLARFEIERQALAMMDHPNIARV